MDISIGFSLRYLQASLEVWQSVMMPTCACTGYITIASLCRICLTTWG